MKGYGLLKHISSNLLKAVFHKFYLVHSCIFCPIFSATINIFLQEKPISLSSTGYFSGICNHSFSGTFLKRIDGIPWNNWATQVGGDHSQFFIFKAHCSESNWKFGKIFLRNSAMTLSLFTRNNWQYLG